MSEDEDQSDSESVQNNFQIKQTDRVPELAKEFISVFSEYSYNNEAYGLVLFHTLIGEMLKEKKIPKGPTEIDPRIHLFLIQDSGTGKSAPLPFIMDLCSDLDINFNSLDSATDAALVGTVERNEYTNEEGEQKVEWEEQKGILGKADIIHFDEGSSIFKGGQHSENMLNYFQKAMNTIGSPASRITKEMAHGDSIVVEPDCSFFVTSYMPPDLEETVVRTGFFQRIMTLPRDIDTETRRDNSRKDADKIGVDSSIDAEYEHLIEKFEEIRDYYESDEDGNGGVDIKIGESKREAFKNEADKLYDKAEHADRATRKILNTFVPRVQEKMYILAYHSAACDLRDEISMNDIWYASDIANFVFSRLITWLEMRMDLKQRTGLAREKKYWEEIMRNWGQYFQEKEDSNQYVSSNQLKKHLPQILGVTEVTAAKYIRIFDNERNWFKSTTKSRTKYYKPNDLQAPQKPNRKSD